MPIISGAKGGITVRELLRLSPAVFRSWMEDKNVADLIDSIRQAKKLRDAGVLTEKESQERIAQLKKDRVDKLELNRQLYEHLQKEYSEKKARLKRLLPYVTYMARFINNIRKNENAIPTGCISWTTTMCRIRKQSTTPSSKAGKGNWPSHWSTLLPAAKGCA